MLAEQNITCSMSRRGDCWDNAAMESFFSTLKLERVNRRRYGTRDEARADLFDYIERFYNPRRSTQRWVTSALLSSSGGLEAKCKCPEKLPADRIRPTLGLFTTCRRLRLGRRVHSACRERVSGAHSAQYPPRRAGEPRKIGIFAGTRRCKCALDEDAVPAETWGRAIGFPVLCPSTETVALILAHPGKLILRKMNVGTAVHRI